MDSPTSIASTRLRAAQRLLVLLVAVLGMLVATTSVASASTLSPSWSSSRITISFAAETRVGVAATPIGTRVGPGGSVLAGQVGQTCPKFVQTMVGSCVATKTGVRALPRSSLPTPGEAADLVRGANPVGSALKSDAAHRAATFAVDDIAANGSVYRIVGGDGVQRTLIQVPGELNGVAGRFEWIVDGAGNLTHQMFVKGGAIRGVPIKP